MNRISKIIKSKRQEKQECVVLQKRFPIEATQTRGVLRIPLISKRLIESGIEKLPIKDEITDIYIPGLQILVQVYFQSEINTPIDLIITDDRIIDNAQNSILGALSGNLICQKLKFTLNTNFNISRSETNMRKTLMVYHNLRGIQMRPGSKLISITEVVGLVSSVDTD